MGGPGSGRFSGKEKYPYDDWADGNPHILVCGRDFSRDLDPKAFGTAVRYAFKRRGLKLKFKSLDWRRVRVMAVRDDS